MATNDGRGRRDSAGIGPYLREGVRLGSLRKLGWLVADGDQDVRGWEVRTVSGRVIGTVHDLLVDEDAKEVVLLDVDLTDSRRRGLVQIRAAEIDRARRVVLVDSADVRDAEEFGTPARATREELAEARGDLAMRESAHRAAGDMRLVRRDALDEAAETAVPTTPVQNADAAPRDPVVVEEVVVRRRVVDAADLPAAEASGARVVRSDEVVDDRLG
ncbi:MAG: PRC-barrel domain-containing protein [Gemmatimonadaceae bacterium]